MQDADDFRRGDATAADFSNWHINTNGLKSMRVSSSERIIEPEDPSEIKEEKDEFESDNLPELADDDAPPQRVNELPKEQSRVRPIAKPMPTRPLPKPGEIPREQPRSVKKEPPGMQEAMLDPNELKMLAKHLLPSVDKVSPEDYAKYSEMAIDFAFKFLNVWKEKIKLGD
jgi:hypothetical protein